MSADILCQQIGGRNQTAFTPAFYCQSAVRFPAHEQILLGFCH